MTKESRYEKLQKCNATILLRTKKFSKVLTLIFPSKFTRKSGLTERRLVVFFFVLTEKMVSFFKTIKSDRQAENLKNQKFDFFLKPNILHPYRPMFCTSELWTDFIFCNLGDNQAKALQ